MFIKQIKKKNTKKGKTFCQYQLTQASRVDGKPKHIPVLYLGSDPLLDDVQNRKTVAKLLQAKIQNQPSLLEEKSIDNELVKLADYYYNKYQQKLQKQPNSAASLPPDEDEADYQEVDLNSTSMEEGREIGAERLCYHMLERLELDELFKRKDWYETDIEHAKIAIIARAIAACSERKTAQWLNENSGLLELFSTQVHGLTRHHLYYAASRLYSIKEELEHHLYSRFVNLFNLEDKLVIYDLTNTYFEGRKVWSEMAKFGRSKEKRSDCKLIVLACVINSEGFIKHSALYRGNMADSNTLEGVLTNLQKYQSASSQKQTIVMDAGIATEENLRMLRAKNLHYICVSRTKLKDYATIREEGTVKLKDKKGNELGVKLLDPEEKPDRWLYVKSQEKRRKEASMNEKLMHRFEEELEQVKAGIGKKGGTKKLQKVWERIGRVKERNQRVHKFYEIDVKAQGNTAVDLTYKKIASAPEQDTQTSGVYFIRTNYSSDNEEELWDIYNSIREVESTFRCLKTDLNLRPVYHKEDQYVEAHLFLAVIAYQLAHAIRYMLRQQGIHMDWRNVVRTMNTQKLVTMTQKTKTKQIGFKQSTRPNTQVQEIYKACNISSMTERLKKFVVYH